jgi:SAM-dependent methyltransferase
MLVTRARSAAVPATQPAVFDAIAEEYDEIFTHSRIGCAQRSLVHEAMRPYLHKGQRLLELNCGTGEDAIRLASRGIQVYACDASERMIDVARRKLARCQASLPATFAVCANENLDSLPGSDRFDGALSNFGGLNCTADLASVARALTDLIRTDSCVFLCLIGRHCVWETVWYGARGQWSKAFRRRRRGGSVAHIGGAPVRIFYPSVREVRDAFAPMFRLEEWRAIGVAVPPSWMESAFRDHPELTGQLTRIDSWLGKLPVFRGAGDHILYRFVREKR